MKEELSNLFFYCMW